MHRSYQSILPCHNKLLQQKWDTTYYNEHRRKVQSAVPVVDTSAPSTYMHLHLKLKKLQLEEERLATIERDNRILLEKMSYIMRTRGRIDNRNNYAYKSLNREKRQRELLRVTAENQEILKRINMRKPEYSVQKWAEDWEENQRFMDNISAFPKDWWVQENKEGKSRQQSARSKKKEEGRPRSKESQKKEKEDKKDEGQKKDEEEDREQEQQQRKEKEQKEEQQRKDKEKKEKEKKEKEEKERKEKEQREREQKEKEERERKEKEQKEREQTTTEESSDPEDSSTVQQKSSSEEQTTDEERKKDMA